MYLAPLRRNAKIKNFRHRLLSLMALFHSRLKNPSETNIPHLFPLVEQSLLLHPLCNTSRNWYPRFPLCFRIQFSNSDILPPNNNKPNSVCNNTIEKAGIRSVFEILIQLSAKQQLTETLKLHKQAPEYTLTFC